MNNNFEEIKVVANEECERLLKIFLSIKNKFLLNYSVPDALRDIYRRNLVDGDFILLYYNCIANFNLNEALKTYIQRKTCKDGKYNVMTKIYKKLPTAHYLRSVEDEIVIVVNKET